MIKSLSILTKDKDKENGYLQEIRRYTGLAEGQIGHKEDL
jgi:hypothetical protein